MTLTGLSPRHAVLLALLAGVALPLAFAPFHLWPLAIVSPAGLYLLWLNAPPRRAAWLGWVYGVGMFGVGASWVHESFQFSHVALPLALLLTALFVAFLGLFPALLGLLLAGFAPAGRRLRLLLLYPAAWVLGEWVRGWFLTGFPWLQLGYSQTDTWLAGLAPLSGVLGISWVVAVMAGLLAMAVTTQGRARQVWAAAALLPLILTWPLTEIHWTTPVGRPLKVALIQGNVPQDQKWRPDQRIPTLRRYMNLTRQHWGADLVVWPETALPQFLDQAHTFLDELAGEARTHGTDLLLGIPVRDPESGRYYNSVLALAEPGGLYHKYHLVPFGEYLPLPWLLDGMVRLLRIPMSNFSPGPKVQPLITVAGYPVGISICYEGVFGEEIAETLPAARLLVNVSNDAWFGDSIAPAQHLQMARMRALETGRYLLRATNTGITSIVGPRGQVLERAPQFRVFDLAGSVRAMAGATPYVRSGNLPVLAGLWFSVGLIVLWGLRHFHRAGSPTPQS